MTRNLQTKAEREMIRELRALQEGLKEEWIDAALPQDWSGLEDRPIARDKTRVTVRLDTDMVRWLRKMGPGYGARINQILRIYWLGLASGKVRSHWDGAAHVPRFERYMEAKIASQIALAARLRDSAAESCAPAEGTEKGTGKGTGEGAGKGREEGAP
ncbi:BrnA antitoxin family protein [uncultured Lentibacter sp.]|uniref:BrnA antitoxin family protein n=1 Tax=uncultured Lentibacter sp. TaxID=1659309 RepID=UPI00260A04A8|nr:BrnA antitoxin family protein [uncultured Lentibacter sp.]